MKQFLSAFICLLVAVSLVVLITPHRSHGCNPGPSPDPGPSPSPEPGVEEVSEEVSDNWDIKHNSDEHVTLDKTGPCSNLNDWLENREKCE